MAALKFSSFVEIKEAPLISFSKKVVPTLSDMPSTSVTHFANSSKFHFCTGDVLSFCTYSGLSNFFTRTESLQSLKVNRFVTMSLPLTSIQTIISVSFLMKYLDHFSPLQTGSTGN